MLESGVIIGREEKGKAKFAKTSGRNCWRKRNGDAERFKDIGAAALGSHRTIAMLGNGHTCRGTDNGHGCRDIECSQPIPAGSHHIENLKCPSFGVQRGRTDLDSMIRANAAISLTVSPLRASALKKSALISAAETR